jgi:3-oxoacyl-[acyl-carrier-protein] synthase II
MRTVVISGVAVAAGCGVLSGAECATLPEASPRTDVSLDLDPYLDAVRARRLDRCARLGVVAVEKALVDSGVGDAPHPGTGVVLGSAFGNVDDSAAFMHRIFEKGPRAASPAEFPNLVPSSPVGHTSIYLGLRGPAFATADLGTSGESAFAQAVQLVATGAADRIVAGVVEPRSGIVERVLGALFAHSPMQATRGRADVSAAVVLETEAEAARRSARVLARVAQVLEWRGEPGDVLARVVAPRGGSAEVVLPREGAEVESLLARTAWAAKRRVVCAPALGESDGLGGVAIAVATARIAARLATDVLVVGLDDQRGYVIVLSAA